MPFVVRLTTVAVVVTALVLAAPTVDASDRGPSAAQLKALVSAEGNVVTLAKRYVPTAAWAKAFETAQAKQEAALVPINEDVPVPVGFQ